MELKPNIKADFKKDLFGGILDMPSLFHDTKYLKRAGKVVVRRAFVLKNSPWKYATKMLLFPGGCLFLIFTICCFALHLPPKTTLWVQIETAMANKQVVISVVSRAISSSLQAVPNHCTYLTRLNEKELEKLIDDEFYNYRKLKEGNDNAESKEKRASIKKELECATLINVNLKSLALQPTALQFQEFSIKLRKEVAIFSKMIELEAKYATVILYLAIFLSSIVFRHVANKFISKIDFLWKDQFQSIWLYYTGLAFFPVALSVCLINIGAEWLNRNGSNWYEPYYELLMTACAIFALSRLVYVAPMIGQINGGNNPNLNAKIQNCLFLAAIISTAIIIFGIYIVARIAYELLGGDPL